MPFWALSIYFSWHCIKSDKVSDYVFLGLVIGLGLLSKYLFLYLVIGIKLLFIYQILKKKIKTYHLIISGLVALLVIFPHLIWLIKNNFETIIYGLQRSGGAGTFADHFINPLKFFFKQVIILIPFFLMLIFLTNKIKIKINFRNKKMIFLFFTCILPLVLMR